MAEQHQRGYEGAHRGGRDRGERDDREWMGDDRLQPSYGGRDGRDDRDNDSRRRFEPHRVSERDSRDSESGGRSTEWSTEGRGGYGSERGEFTPHRHPGDYGATRWAYGDGGQGYGSSSRYGSGSFAAGEPEDDSNQGYRELGGDGSSTGAREWNQGRSGWGQPPQGSSWQRGGSGGWQPSRGRSGRGHDSDGGPAQWSTQGGRGQGYAGRGPKNYQRSDERIREEIADRMTDDDNLDASEISVQVQQGDVTLTGTVQSRDQKRRAEDLAEQCSGVKDVVNNIRVARDNTAQSSQQSSSSRSGSSPLGSQASQAGQKATGKSTSGAATA